MQKKGVKMDSGEIFGVTLTTLCLIGVAYEIYKVRKADKKAKDKQ